jgi:hypothetical protein
VTVTSGTLTKTVTVTQQADTPVLEVDKTTIDAAASGGAYTVGVTSNATWTANVNSGATWCTLTNANATGNGTVTVNIAANTAAVTRAATVTVTSGTLTKTVAVTQAAAGLVLNVDKTTIEAGTNAANYSIGVTSNATWTATVSSGASWCTLTNANATGNGNITVNVAENPTIETRTATVSVTSGTLTRAVAVTQTAATPELNVNMTAINVGSYATSEQLFVTSSSTWTASVSSSASWCTLVNANGSGNGAITVNVAANVIAATRVTTVTVTSGTLTKTVTVTQAAAELIFEVDKTTINATINNSAYRVAVTTNNTWTATVSSGASWCTLTNDNGNGNGTVTVNVAANSTIVTRTAAVTITSGTLTKTINVMQAAAALVLNVDNSAIPAIATAATYPISVTNNSTWTATVSSGASWCTLTNAGATGNGTVTVNVAENPTIETRAATVTLTSGTLTRTVAVMQAAAAPVLNVDKTTIDAAVVADLYQVSVTSNLAWTATVSSGASWCTLTNASATDNGTIIVNVAANTIAATRAATVTVTGGTLTKTIVVTQAAPAPVLEVNKTTIDAPISATAYSIGITSNDTWMATVSSAATWCTLTNANATGNGTITVNVAANTMAATRAATVTVTSGSLTKTIAVTQAAAAHILSCPNTINLNSYSQEDILIYVTCNSTWSATINSAATWCKMQYYEYYGRIYMDVKGNSVALPRAATITVTSVSTSGTLTQTIVVTQAAAAPTLDVDKTIINATWNAASYTIGLISNGATWTAAVNSAATWCTLTNNSGTGNGTITVNVITDYKVTGTRTATVTLTSGTRTLPVTVAQLYEAPTYAASTQTWNIGRYTWSDVIQMPECDKEEFAISTTTPQCRSYTSGMNTWYYYNSPYVLAHIGDTEMCPSPWMIPQAYLMDDLVANIGTGYSVPDVWRRGGRVYDDASIIETTEYAWLGGAALSSSGAFEWEGKTYSTVGARIGSVSSYIVAPWGREANGLQLRCVKNK